MYFIKIYMDVIFYYFCCMKKSLTLFIFIVLVIFSKLNAQIIDTVVICNGDSVLLFNNWETQTGNYTNGDVQLL